jgi:hypothetical protein
MFKPNDFSDLALIVYLMLSSEQPKRPQIDRLREAAAIAEEMTTESNRSN